MNNVTTLSRPGMLFVQDGAKAHTSAESIGYLGRKGVNVVPDWPARSPDLNVIEMLWGRIQRDVSRYAPTDEEQLEAYFIRCWEAIPQAEIDHLVLSFSFRLQRCIDNAEATIN